MENVKNINDGNIIGLYHNIINELGKFGPFMSSLWLIYSLGKAEKRLKYIGFILLNVIVNMILKLLIKNERPSKECSEMDITVSNMEFDKYGFPSGHTQLAFFNFLVSVGSKNYEDIIFFILFIITIYQRFKSGCHTLIQIIGGIVIGYVMYAIYEHINF